METYEVEEVGLSRSETGLLALCSVAAGDEATSCIVTHSRATILEKD